MFGIIVLDCIISQHNSYFYYYLCCFYKIVTLQGIFLGVQSQSSQGRGTVLMSHSLSSHCWSPSWWPWWNRSGREDIHHTPPASCLRSQWAHVADEALKWHRWSWHMDMTINIANEIIKKMDNDWNWNQVAAQGGGSVGLCSVELSPYCCEN